MECLGHHRKGTPGAGNVYLVLIKCLMSDDSLIKCFPVGRRSRHVRLEVQPSGANKPITLAKRKTMLFMY